MKKPRLIALLGRRARLNLAWQSALFFADALLMALFYYCCAKAAAQILILKQEVPEDILLAAALCACARFLLQLILAFLNASLSEKSEHLLRLEIFAAMARQGPFSPALSPALASSTQELSEAVVPYFAAYRRTMRQVMILPLVLLFCVYFASPLSALVLAALCPLVPLFMVLIGLKARELNDRQLLQIKRLSNRFFEALSHLPLIFAYNLSSKELAAVRRMSRRWRVETMHILYVAFLSALALEFFATVGVAFCAITLGFAVYEQGFSYEQALFVLLCAPEFFLPLRKLGQHYHAKQRALAAAAAVEDLFAPAPWVPTAENSAAGAEKKAADLTAVAAENIEPTGKLLQPAAASPAHCQATAYSVSVSSRSADSLQPQFSDLKDFKLKAVRFCEISARYPDGRLGLERASFELGGGQINVLTGPSGCGKSTALNVLAGLLRPCAGSVELSLVHSSGRECQLALADLSPRQWADLFTFVPQRPYFSYGTLRSNLRLAAPQASDEELYLALTRAGAQQVLSFLPQGLDSFIGDDHAGISGGQARLFALARALLKPAPLLLLDEPSASLDADLELKLAGALKNLAALGQLTLVIAAHRPQLIALAQREIKLGPV